MKQRSGILVSAVVCVALLAGSAALAQTKEDEGAFSSYLVGTYESRLGVFSTINIVNPTAAKLNVVIALFAVDGSCKLATRVDVPSNGLYEALVPTLGKDLPDHGVVKVISRAHAEADTPTRGVVGFERHFHLHVGFSESAMASVPTEVAEKELPKILSSCPWV